MTEDELSCETVLPARQPLERGEIGRFLAQSDLDYEPGVEVFVVFRREGTLVACAGLEKNIVKCVAISEELRGESIGLKLLTEIVGLAQDRGYSHLFLYTKPDNVPFFRGCGFYPLVEVPGRVAFMENTPVGLPGYCARLRGAAKAGGKIGAIVMNANPFTLGHLYLIERAAAECDWLHVFVVAEEASLFSYRDRFAMVSEGTARVARMTLHHGSSYMVSRATFSSYFFKEKGIVGDCCTAVDLLVFRNWIAPALGVTHRFVGTEPFCPTTRKYNADMHHWLAEADSSAAPVETVEIPRLTYGETPISASEVRRLLTEKDFAAIAHLVPPTTLDFLRTRWCAPAMTAA